MKDVRTEKLEKVIELAVKSGFDCFCCKKLGIDAGKCSGDCKTELMKFLGVADE